MFRAKDREWLSSVFINLGNWNATHSNQMDRIEAKLKSLAEAHKNSYDRLQEEFIQRITRLEVGQNVVKADLDAISARLTDIELKIALLIRGEAPTGSKTGLSRPNGASIGKRSR